MADFATSTHPAVQAQLDRLSMLSPAGDRLGLERIAALLDRLGRPQDRLPPVFHVAGTNGKGSTCAFLRAALEAADCRVHAFTSPHLVRFNERIRTAGRLIEDEPLAALLAEVLDSSGGIEPSFFEVATAAALLAFARTPADACILEVGLGGRLDATNVVERPAATGIASLALDHQQFLGRTIADIAAEKAGIAKPGVPLLTQLYPPQVGSRIRTAALDAGAVWLPRGSGWDAAVRGGRIRYRDRGGSLDLPLPRLPGRHQAMNAALAVAMLRHQSALDVPDAALAAAVARIDWPGRMQRLFEGPLARLLPTGSELWLDGGHNPSAARAIAEFVQLRFADDLPLVLLFASLGSKNARGVLAPFRGLAAEVLTVPIAGHEHRDPKELAQLARSLGFRAEAFEAVADALSAIRRPARVLIFGSLYLAGQVLAANGQLPD
ncbi:MAG TPA: folylpolyglutamate synthase/dihydrofolate synthase family protein [Sphingomicrobium sp.]|nr:folylpolyglutamate synthase/dihydrofolate synthase family protein [Sphingomicrobium sp.]